MYNYIDDPDLAAPRKWFQANVEQVLKIYGTEHEVQREDLMLGKFSFYQRNFVLC